MPIPFVNNMVAVFPIIMFPSSDIALFGISSNFSIGMPPIIIEAIDIAVSIFNEIITCPRNLPVRPTITATESLGYGEFLRCTFPSVGLIPVII